MHVGMKGVSDYGPFFSEHPCQLFCRDFFLSSSYCLLSSFKNIFSMPETAAVYFCEYRAGKLRVASCSVAQEGKGNQERRSETLQGFLLCFSHR